MVEECEGGIREGGREGRREKRKTQRRDGGGDTNDVKHSRRYQHSFTYLCI